jgi:hypothetical protein
LKILKKSIYKERYKIITLYSQHWCQINLINTNSSHRQTCSSFWLTWIQYSRTISAILIFTWALPIIIFLLRHYCFLPDTSYLLQTTRTHRALMNTVFIKWTQIPWCCVKCLQPWTYTAHNIACLMLMHISSLIILPAVCSTAALLTQIK